MPRWIKLSLKIVGIFLVVVIIGWIVIAVYVQSHKKELLASITSQLNEDLNGTLIIEKMEPALIRGFPGISVTLSNILLRDSLWEQHKHDVLKAEEAYVSVDAFSVLRGDPTIKNISISNGNLYFYTDSTGYSNTDLSKKTKEKNSKGEVTKKKFNKIDLQNVNLIMDNVPKSNYFSFDINRFSTKVNYNAGGWKAAARVNTIVKSLSFNTRRGSFVKNQTVKTDLDLTYDDKSQTLTIPSKEVLIGGNTFYVDAKINLSENQSAYALDISTPEIMFKDAVKLFSPNISSRLKYYDLKEPLSANATIQGKLKAKGDPKIVATWQVKENTLVANGETITNCSFNGMYKNESVEGGGFTDPNSIIAFYGMKGNWNKIPFTADSITITDLKKPVLAGKFKSSFPLTRLNRVLGNQTFSFSKGTARLNLNYKAPYSSEDQSQRYINGDIQISNASMRYLPRNLPFTNVRGRINFREQDLFFQNMNVQSGGSSLQMEGSIRNFLNFFYTDPQKMLIDWHIKSPQINLGQFLSFLGRRQSKASTSNVRSFSTQLDRTLNEAHVHMKAEVERLIYKKFVATKVNSNISLKQQGIGIDNISLKHAGGGLQIKGQIDQTGTVNKISLKTKITDANIQQLFFAFNNFGQDAITEKNLRGVFSADCDISGSLRDNGDVVPRSIRGTVFFNLRNGALVNFEPMEKIGSFAFANRDFSNITFNKLSNTLTLKGNTVAIPPMQIESSVLNIFLEGIYGFSSGTNIAMQVPLRNPKKDEFVFDEAEKEKRSKRGIVINLRAVDGEDGKVKFKLGN